MSSKIMRPNCLIKSIKMPLVVKKPLSWMNFVPPTDVTANMPSESLNDLNALPNQKQRKKANPPFIKMKQSSNPSRKFG